MENDDAIVGTILSRRAVLGLAARSGLGITVGGILLNSADAAYQRNVRKTIKLVASPAVTEGPFFVDEKLKRSNLLTGTKRPSVVDGMPITLTFTLYRLTDGIFAPLKGATVDVWHADAKGVYSDQSNPMNHENTGGQNWLRGYQVSDADGMVQFKTIVPGWYPSRTTHIHFKVRQIVKANATKEFTSQLFFNDTLMNKIFEQAPYVAREAHQVRNSTDMVYMEQQADGSLVGDHLALNLKPSKTGRGYTANFAVALTEDNLRSGRPAHRFGGPPPGGFPPGGPPPGGFGGFEEP